MSEEEEDQLTHFNRNINNNIGTDDMETDATPSPQSYDYGLTSHVIHATSSIEPVFMEQQQDATIAGINSVPTMKPNFSHETADTVNHAAGSSLICANIAHSDKTMQHTGEALPGLQLTPDATSSHADDQATHMDMGEHNAVSSDEEQHDAVAMHYGASQVRNQNSPAQTGEESENGTIPSGVPKIGIFTENEYQDMFSLVLSTPFRTQPTVVPTNSLGSTKKSW